LTEKEERNEGKRRKPAKQGSLVNKKEPGKTNKTKRRTKSKRRKTKIFW
jgi:hypothetical protein